MLKSKLAIGVVIFLVFLLTACASAPTPTPQPTHTSTATYIPTPTLTATPTLTPLPTSTPTATPDLLKEATAKSEAHVLELAKKQGLTDVQAKSFWDQTTFRQTFRPEYKLVSILQSTTDKTRYWFPSADGAALSEARVPQDAKETSWDFTANQLTCTLKYGTQMWWDDGSNLWLRGPGHLETYKPGEEQQAVEKWLARLKITNNSSTKTIARYYEMVYNFSKTNEKGPITFKGGAHVSVEMLIREALVKYAASYTSPYTSTEDFSDVLPTLTRFTGLRALSNIKEIVVTDNYEATRTLRFDSDEIYSARINARFDPMTGVLLISPRSLIMVPSYDAITSDGFLMSQNFDPVVVFNIVRESLIAMAELTTTVDLTSSCKIPFRDHIRPVVENFSTHVHLPMMLKTVNTPIADKMKDFSKALYTDAITVNSYRAREKTIAGCR